MRVLCAVDGSEFSQWGVQALETLAWREPEHVVLLHVIDRPALLAGKGKNVASGRRAMAAMEKAGALLLREAERSANVALGQAATGRGTKLHRVLAHGPLASTIAQQARRWKADLILMGSRGLSDIKGFLLGSVSRHVASMASCSVFIVKQPSPKLTRVTLAVDDS
ncbi:MAG TPA: universal stress protein, partial [Nitrospira sp.]|nr:universal stress protein [Nitrospira sp.]